MNAIAGVLNFFEDAFMIRPRRLDHVTVGCIMDGRYRGPGEVLATHPLAGPVRCPHDSWSARIMTAVLEDLDSESNGTGVPLPH